MGNIKQSIGSLHFFFFFTVGGSKQPKETCMVFLYYLGLETDTKKIYFYTVYNAASLPRFVWDMYVWAHCSMIVQTSGLTDKKKTGLYFLLLLLFFRYLGTLVICEN